jgi:hypothetical protein
MVPAPDKIAGSEDNGQPRMKRNQRPQPTARGADVGVSASLPAYHVGVPATPNAAPEVPASRSSPPWRRGGRRAVGRRLRLCVGAAVHAGEQQASSYGTGDPRALFVKTQAATGNGRLIRFSSHWILCCFLWFRSRSGHRSIETR